MIVLGVDSGYRYMGLSVVEARGQKPRFRMVETFDALLYLTGRVPCPSSPDELRFAHQTRLRQVLEELDPEVFAIESIVNIGAVRSQKGRQSRESLEAIATQAALKVVAEHARYKPLLVGLPPLSWKRSHGLIGLSDKLIVQRFQSNYGVDFTQWPVKQVIHGVEAGFIGATGARVAARKRTGS